MNTTELKDRITDIAATAPETPDADFFSLFESFLAALERGEIRAAEKRDGQWSVNTWVKQGILLGFKYGYVRAFETEGSFKFYDKHTYPTQDPDGVNRNVRIVPGGSSVRAGAYVGNDVTMMPPMYVNTGAHIGKGSMIDSHALVGSCAQLGEHVHLSASAQLGGVLEPIKATPVIVEDECMIGGNTGIYEGTRVGRRAVIGAGVILTASTPVYDLVHETVYKASKERPLEIPEQAVVIPGARAVTNSPYAKEHGISVITPVIIKYRDDKTDQATALESLLR